MTSYPDSSGPASVREDPILQDAVNRIVQTFEPIRVYLFGSRAWGRPGDDSDYDLLVIVEDGIDERQAAGRMAVSLFGIRAAFDIVVRTRSWWSDWSDAPFSLEERISTEGLILHDAA